MLQITYLCMITGNIIALTLQTSVAKWVSAFNKLCRFFIAFLPSKEQVSFNFVAGVKVHSDFGAQENKICHCFHFSLIYMPWSGGTGYHECWVFFVNIFWMLSFKPAFFISSAYQLVFSSLLSAIRVVSSSYLWMLILLPAILIPACASSSLAFHMMYSAYKLNKQGDNIQHWRIPFPIWNQSVVPCPVLTVASWSAYRFLKKQVRWSGIPISFRIFHCLLWSTESKALA